MATRTYKPRGVSYGAWLVSNLAETENGCLEPTVLRLHHSGYYRVGGGGYKSTQAHRAVWEHLVGPIPDGMVLDHTCRNRKCSNIEHLRVVTPQVNVTENVEGTAWQVHAAKTHCPQGHAYEGDNLYVAPTGDRTCRACRTAANSKQAAKRKERRREHRISS